MGQTDKGRSTRAVRGLVAAIGIGAVAMTATAQTTAVVPPAQTTVEGTGSTNVPFGRSTSVRVQMAYDPSLFGGPVTLDGMRFRLDGAATALGKQVELEVRLSTMPFAVTVLQSTFAINRGVDETVVVDRQVVDLPAQFAVQSPAPFQVHIPFNRSFSYRPALGPLLVEVVVHRQDPGSYPLDTTYLCDSPRASVGPVGCGAPSTLQALVPTAQVLWGRPVSLQVRDAPSGAPAAIVFGTKDSGKWAGLTLPVDLTVYGAPGCHVSIDWLTFRATTADNLGVATFTLNVPSVPALRNQWVRYQGLALDPSANALGAITSRAGKIQVCGWDPVARVFAPQASAQSGVREAGVVPVIELTVQ